jgi:hypothetical protein
MTALVQEQAARLQQLESKYHATTPATAAALPVPAFAAAAPAAPSLSQPHAKNTSRKKPSTAIPASFEPRQMERSILCAACRDKAMSPTFREEVAQQLIRTWYDSTFEFSPSGMPRRSLLNTHLNPFLLNVGLRPLDTSYPAWQWFLKEVAGMSDQEIKASKTAIRVQPRPVKTELIAAVTQFLKQLTAAQP